EGDFGESGLGEQALVSQVMNSEQGPAAEKGGVGRESGAQVGGQEAGLPVVAVKDIGSKQDAGNAEGGAAEYGKTNVVVRVVQTGFAVEAFSAVERRAIHQVNGIVGRRLVDGDREGNRAELNREVVPDAAGGFQIDGGVAGDDHGHFVAEGAQGRGE